MSIYLLKYAKKLIVFKLYLNIFKIKITKNSICNINFVMVYNYLFIS